MIAAVASGALSGVFAGSAIAKLRRRDATAGAMRSLGLPARIGDSLAAIELFTALGLVMERRTPWSAAVAVALLVIFTLFVLLRLSDGIRVPCPCFGSDSSPIGARTIARNGALLALAVVATASRGSAWWIAWVVMLPTLAVIAGHRDDAQHGG